jgi:hypothetical protein
LNEQKQTTEINDWRVLIVGTIIVSGLIAGVIVLAWRGMSHVEADAARAWALVATLLLPLGIWIGYRLGHTEAKGRLRGIDDGLDRVVHAASKAIDLRVTNITRTKTVQTDTPNVVVLPPPESAFTMRPQLPSGDVVELE